MLATGRFVHFPIWESSVIQREEIQSRRLLQ